MGIINFIIVFSVIIYIRISIKEKFINMYNGKITTWFTVAMWLYSLWGLANLIYSIIEQKIY